MRQHDPITMLFILLILLPSACSADQPQQTPHATTASSAASTGISTLEPSATVMDTHTPAPTGTPTPTATPTIGPPGGEIIPFTRLKDEFLPLLKTQGITDAIIDKIICVNPARAFACRS